MIKIDLLKNHPDAIPVLANIWHEVLGKIWFPELTIGEIESLTYDELNHLDETNSFVALHDEIPVGFCTFKLKEEFRPDLGPWLADVVVAPNIKNRGSEKCWLISQLDKQRSVASKSYTSLLLIQRYLNTTSALDGTKYVWMNFNLIL